MRLAAQTLGWLLAHELRLTWRRLRSNRTPAWRTPVLIGVFLLAALAIGGPVGFALRGFNLSVTRSTIFAGDAAMVVFLVWMLSQALAAAIEAFFTRGDLDLLFSSPVDPGKVLVVRCLAIALNVFTGFAVFVSPLMIPLALMGHSGWLALYPILAAAALTATAMGLILASVLLRLLGPKRARATAQIMAVVLGGVFFIAGQLPNMLGLHKLKAWILTRPSTAPATDHLERTMAAWPVRAFSGDLGSLVAMLALGVVAFLTATFFIGRRFSTDSAAAAGLAAATVKRRAVDGSPFVGGVMALTIRKELRVLGRDITLVATVLFRLIYLVPLALILVRSASQHLPALIPVGVGTVAFMVGQTVLTLAMIMIAGEDSPDLLLSSPAGADRVRHAKMAAAILPVAFVMAGPLLALLLLEPVPGLAAVVGCGGIALANTLIAARLQKPAPRAAFRRRGGGASLTAAMVSLVISGLIAASAGMAAAASLYAILPLMLAVAGLVIINEIKLNSAD